MINTAICIDMNMARCIYRKGDRLLLLEEVTG